VTETVWHHTPTVSRHPDGSATLRFTIDGLEELERWVLGWVGRVDIVRPKELRDRVRTRLETALRVISENSIVSDGR
jgi:predicted DNA-binding transcriptional regulator YafY